MAFSCSVYLGWAGSSPRVIRRSPGRLPAARSCPHLAAKASRLTAEAVVSWETVTVAVSRSTKTSFTVRGDVTMSNISGLINVPLSLREPSK